MSSNYYRYRIDPVPKDKFIEIPVQITFDNLGREDGIKEFEEDVIEEIITPISDFETTSFAHASWGNSETNINYEFYFYNGGSPETVTATTNDNNWVIDYEAADFLDKNRHKKTHNQVRLYFF